MTIEEAIQHGQFESAVQLLEKAIKENPKQAGHHANLSIALCRLGRLVEAAAACRRAIAMKGVVPEFHNNLGSILRELGQFDQSIASCKLAMKFRPAYPEALNNLGGTYAALGKRTEAMACFVKAIGMKPGFAEAHFNLAIQYHESGNPNAAAAHYHKALTALPNWAQAWNHFGCVLSDLGQMTNAITALKRAVELSPRDAQAWSNLAGALVEVRQYQDAVAAGLKALELQPNSFQALCNLGNGYWGLDQFDRALAAFEKSIAIRPTSRAYMGIGSVYSQQRELDRSLEACRSAIAFDPSDPMPVWNESLVLLLKGDLERAWPGFETRMKIPAHARWRLNTPQPAWDGSELNGKRILLHAEQGFGDTIHFVRYAPLVAKRGGRVILHCQPELTSLLGSLPGIEQCVARGQPLPEHDVQCALPSLPAVFKTTLDSIPAEVPYLRPDTEKAAFWRNRLADERRLKVGLAWAGNPGQLNDRNRSMAAAELAPLARIQHVRWVCLQKGSAQSQLPPFELADWTSELSDFSDTAALVDRLDLVLTVDTAIAHLAGAMKKPVWVMLAFLPDWRWLLDREDSPWYPGMQLFRQTKTSVWTDVIERVAARLAQMHT